MDSMSRMAMGLIAAGSAILLLTLADITWQPRLAVSDHAAPRARRSAPRSTPRSTLGPRAASAAMLIGDPGETAALLRDPDPQVRWRALQELIAWGPDGVPALLGILRVTDDLPPPMGEERWLGEDWMTAAYARYAVLEIGEPAIAPLARALEDGKLKRVAIRLLGQVGTRHGGALAHLTPLLRSSDEETAYTAAFAIGAMGARGLPALLDLEALFDREDLSWAAADTIVDLGPGAVATIERVLLRTRDGRLMGNLRHLDADRSALIPALIEALRNGEPWQKRDAAWALEELAPTVPAAAEAHDVLLEYALSDETLGWSTSISGNTCCANALIAIGVSDEETEMLLDGIVARGERVSESFLLRIARSAPDRAERLARRMVSVSYGAPNRLVALGPVTAPLLRRKLRDSTSRDRASVLAALTRMGLPPPESTALLRDAEPSVRAAAVEAVTQRGEPVPPELLDDEATAVRLAAARALAGVIDRALDVLIELTKGDDSYWRDAAVSALRKHGPRARRALPALLRLRDRVEPGGGPYAVRREKSIPPALLLLADLAPLEPEALAIIRRGLDATYAADRVGSAMVLQRCGVEVGEVLQVLLEGMRPANWRHLGMSSRRYRHADVRVAAIEAAGRLGASARPALPLLEDLLDDRSPDVREAARRALAQLDRRLER